MTNKQLIYEKYEAFISTEDVKDKETIRQEIKNLIEFEPVTDSELFYIMGLVDYMSIDWKSLLPNSISNFKKAIKLDSNNFLAQLYLAHCYHDSDDLDIALKNYLKVDQKELKNFQVWRYVKLIEQIGYCYYKLGHIKKGEKYFEEVLEWYKKLPEIDRVVPSDLIACLSKNHRIVKEIKKIEGYLD